MACVTRNIERRISVIVSLCFICRLWFGKGLGVYKDLSKSNCFEIFWDAGFDSLRFVNA